jgi:hypothetical protein
MILVTMNRTLLPNLQARHDYALPDAAAAQLIESGEAVRSPRHDESGLRADAPPPRAGYLTRSKRPRA